MKKTYTTIWGTPIVNKETIKWIDEMMEQKKHLDKNKKYIFDPFVGFIERKEA